MCLSDDATPPILAALAPGVTPEMAAAVSKICRLQDLMIIASKCHVTTRFRSTVGLPGCLSVRLQPTNDATRVGGLRVTGYAGIGKVTGTGADRNRYLGLLSYKAIAAQDLPVILGVTIIGSLFIVLANIIVDVLYAYVDPRVRLS